MCFRRFVFATQNSLTKILFFWLFCCTAEKSTFICGVKKTLKIRLGRGVASV